MLHEAELMARRYSGHGSLWKHPYANPQPRAASAMASVWFTAYPARTSPGRASRSSRLGDEELWRLSARSASRAAHRADEALGRNPRARVHADHRRQLRPHLPRDRPGFGTEDEYQAPGPDARAATTPRHRRPRPAHSGKGADFRLAERGYQDYPGIYHMVEIEPEDWPLPPVPTGKDPVNLKPEAVDQLKARATSSGSSRAPSSSRDVKETDWTATDEVAGADGKAPLGLPPLLQGGPAHLQLARSLVRRAAARRRRRVHSMGTLGETHAPARRHGFLGIEAGRATAAPGPRGTRSRSRQPAHRRPGPQARRLHLPGAEPPARGHQAIRQGGADLSYDFVTRPALPPRPRHRRRRLLRLMLGLQETYRSSRPAHPRPPEPRRAHPRARPLLDHGTRTTRSPSAASR